MAVTETLRALGSWALTFKKGMPDDVWKAIDYFGHIAVVPGRRPGLLDDSLLRTARYVGPVTKISDNTAERRSIGGTGMALWLGDAEGKGDVFLEAITVDGDFDDVIRELLPASGAVTEGTLFTTGETFGPSTFQYQTPREIIDYICQTLGDHAWRVNGDGTLDAGLEADLFIVNPKCIVVAKDINVDDLLLRGLAGMAETDRDVEDYTTGVALLAQGINGQFVSAEEELTAGEIPFVDIHGNKVKRTRIIQESDTDATNAPARALLQLNRFKSTRDALTLSTTDYDIKGKAQVGDYLWVYDPGMDLLDVNNEVIFRGMRVNPFRLRLTETTWPVTSRMSVLYRAGSGEWLDLSQHFVPEQGASTLVVGGYNRSLTEGGGGTFPIVLPDVNSTIPGAPTWNEPFLNGIYQSPSTGETRAEVILDWNRPENTDSSTITDGDHYEIRYRQSTTPLYPVTWGQLEATGATWGSLEAAGATWAHPIVYPQTDWQVAIAPFDVEKFRIGELTASMPYEVQIRAVDNGKPANASAWSTLAVFQTTNDTIAPSTPAPPEIQSNPMAVLMVHNLGRSSGGEFNLEPDLSHMELHGGFEPLFVCTDSTIVGKVSANYGMMLGAIPAIRDFQITSQAPVYYKVIAVDQAGNKSLPSTAVVATAGLIGSQYIQSLIASKITSGTVSADLIVGNRIATMNSGSFPGVELSFSGLRGYGTLGQTLWHATTDTGKIMVYGRGGIEITDGALTVKNATGNVIVEVGECADGRHGIQVYKDNGATRVARMGELASGAEGIEVINDSGQLVRVDTLAFGIQAASVATKQARSGGFGDLATVGPLVNVNIGNSGRCVVILSGGIEPGVLGGGNGAIGFDMVGPGGYSRAANVFEGIWMAILGDNVITDTSVSKAILVTGLPSAGVYTIAMKYWTGGASHSFFDRHLIAIPF